MVKVSLKESIFAYVDSYSVGIDIERIFGLNTYRLFCHLARKMRSRVETIMCCFLAAVAAVLGHRAELVGQPSNIRANIYLILVSERGTGKTFAYKNVYQKPVADCFTEYKKKPLVHDITFSGFFTKVEADGPEIIFAGDEYSSILKKLCTANKTDEFAGFRSSVLNDFFGRDPTFAKTFATRGAIQVKDCYLNLFGTVQPQPFISLLEVLDEETDGCSDRHIIFSASGEIVEIQLPDEIPPWIENFSMVEMLKNLYLLHHPAENNDKRLYELSPDAALLIEEQNDANNADRNEMFAKVRRIIEAQKEAGTSTSAMGADVNVEVGESKRVELSLKMSLIKHAITATIDTIARGGDLPLDIPLQIEKETVLRSMELVDKSRDQKKPYRALIDSHKSRRSSVSSVDMNVGGRNGTPEQLVLLYPGKQMTSNMMNRRHRISKSSVLLAFEKLADGANKLGIYKRFGGRDRKAGFFKYNPTKVTVEMLAPYAVSHAQYVGAFNKNEREHKVSGIGGDWDPYVNELQAARPAEADEAPAAPRPT